MIRSKTVKMKVGRIELMQKLLRVVRLPDSKKTQGTLTRAQLVELIAYIEGLQHKIVELSTGQDVVVNEMPDSVQTEMPI